MTLRKNLVAGNWKMNGLQTGLGELSTLLALHPTPACEIVLCPPATLLSRMSVIAADGQIKTGGQDCHVNSSGAHTGDIGAAMLADAGADYVILGHSERRADHGDTDDDVRNKALAAIDAGLKVIICVGETLSEREAANTLDIIGGQLAGSVPDLVTGENLVVAYEPIWAIGTGKIPTLAQIGEVHDFIRMRIERRFGPGVGRSARILYGGSVKPGNAKEIFDVSNVDGALVGGAALKAADISPIIVALEASV
ncbi:MAG: triose-phosphate isomerase [Paracoccaceae bacterium]